jgi:hypothetical protein
VTVYKAPTGNFEIFLNKLDIILKTLHKTDAKVIVCGDINIDYLSDSEKKRQLDAVLLSYNLFAIVHFPTRSQYQSSTTIDNIFIDTYKFTNYTVLPLHNGLSDYDAQLLKINDVNLQQQNHQNYSIRNINKHSIEEFKTRLSYETWDIIFNNILPLHFQYILSLLLFVVSNWSYFKENSDIHNINTRTKSNLHQPSANVTAYQKGTYYYGIKVFNRLPSQIKDLSANRNLFRCKVENFLYSHSFYTLDEYFSYNCIKTSTKVIS